MNLSTFDIEFFELAHTLKQPLTTESVQSLKKTLLKLNNPTYYRKHTSTHPGAQYGYYQNTVLNPVLRAISSMIALLKEPTEHTQSALQQEYAWAFHNFTWYQTLEQRSA